MNKFFAVFLLSALAVSASAFTMHDFVEILSGFTTGFDFAEVNPAFHNCSAIINATKTSSHDVMAKLDDMTPEAFEQAVSKFGYNAAHSVRVCQHAKNVFIAFLELVEKEIKVLSSADIIGHLMNNLPVVTMKWTTMMKSIKSQDFHNAGIMIADLFRLMATGEVRTTQLRRQLSELSNLVTPQMVVDYNATVLGFLGFIEEGNTTFVANDYLTFVNHTTDFIGQFAALEAALEKFDFQAIINTVTNISKNAKVVAADAALLKQQAAAFAARDLPLFSSEAQITKAVESLFLDLPKTLTNIQRISGAYKTRDYREIGHGSGAVYNQLRDGAQRQ